MKLQLYLEQFSNFVTAFFFWVMLLINRCCLLYFIRKISDDISRLWMDGVRENWASTGTDSDTHWTPMGPLTLMIKQFKTLTKTSPDYWWWLFHWSSVSVTKVSVFSFMSLTPHIPIRDILKYNFFFLQILYSYNNEKVASVLSPLFFFIWIKDFLKIYDS